MSPSIGSAATLTENATSASSPDRSVPVTVTIASPGVVPYVSSIAPSALTRADTTSGSELSTRSPTVACGAATTVADRTDSSRSKIGVESSPASGSVSNVPYEGPSPSNRSSAA